MTISHKGLKIVDSEHRILEVMQGQIEKPTFHSETWTANSGVELFGPIAFEKAFEM